ncbi:helix-turn-helix domain-containing protein [Vibrio zhanjiangensis]|nr:helix-turn-helix transcriptional regulator [Vibrio zhanjiangensis]
MSTIGDRVKMAIHSRGKSPADIERETGIAKSYISRVINNKITSPKKFIKQISEHLLISEEWILTGTGNIDVDPKNSVKVFDILENKYSGNIVIYNLSKIEGSVSAWKGFTFPPFSKESILITIPESSNSNGDYLIKNNDGIYLAIRYNDEYESRWIFKNGLKIIENIRNYDVIGIVIAAIIDDRIKTIEI